MPLPLFIHTLIRRVRRDGAGWTCLLLAAAALFPGHAHGEDTASMRFYVRQYRVVGAHQLKPLEIEEAVYPFLGPSRTPDDVEAARQSLEKAFHDKGYQTVSVSIPQQDPRRGVIRLDVAAGKVGRLRVKGARWFLPSRIKQEVPSVAEGTVPDFNQVGREMVAVNRLADRRVTPELRPGVEPGTVDIDLTVEDKLPLHGSLELNNRYSADTTELRLNGALSYGNLFQLGHTLGASVQVAPENTDDALVYSAYYLARVTDKMSLMLQGTKQDSDISTLGGAAVGGRGKIAGIRAVIDLPTSKGFYQTFNFGIDYKDFDEDLVIGEDTIKSPIEYMPISANYSASWMAEKSFTELNTSLNLHLRGMGSGPEDYANKRYNASGNFIYLRADASHTRDIAGGAQIFGKIQGQASGSPLVNSEQYAGGGLGTARGYLEATQLGDNGLFGTVELRSPNLAGESSVTADPPNQWRFHAFADAGLVGIYDSLPDAQGTRDWFASIGIGTRMQALDHYHGSLDVALPLIRQPNADNREVRITFRGWADF